MRILIIDDEQDALTDIRTKLTGRIVYWDIDYASSAEEAEKLMDGTEYQVVVADSHLPGMTGDAFMKDVASAQPDAIRIVISDHFDAHQVIARTSGAHQYLSKPCDTEELVSTIKRMSEIREELASYPLKQLLHRVRRLPSLPSIFLEISREIESPASSLERVGRIISKDMAMTSKVLQLVNSAFFGLRQKITDPGHAAAILGVNTIRSLVLSNDLMSQFDESKLAKYRISELWEHSTLVAFTAREFATRWGKPGDTALPDSAFLAGFLHDAGKLILAHDLSKEYAKVMKLMDDEGMLLTEAETSVLGADHAHVGGYLLGIWGLGDDVVEAVLRHHWPSDTRVKGFTPLTAVHMANAVSHAMEPEDATPDMDTAYLRKMGLDDKVDEMKSIFRQVSENAAAVKS